MRVFKTLASRQQKTVIHETHPANEVSPNDRRSCPQRVSKSLLRAGSPGGNFPSPWVEGPKWRVRGD